LYWELWRGKNPFRIYSNRKNSTRGTCSVEKKKTNTLPRRSHFIIKLTDVSYAIEGGKGGSPPSREEEGAGIAGEPSRLHRKLTDESFVQKGKDLQNLVREGEKGKRHTSRKRKPEHSPKQGRKSFIRKRKEGEGIEYLAESLSSSSRASKKPYIRKRRKWGEEEFAPST